MQTIPTNFNPSKEIISQEILQRITLLTPSEYKIFRLMGRGLETKEICKLRGSNEKTISSQKTSVKEKLLLNNTLEVYIQAIRYQILAEQHPEITVEPVPKNSPRPFRNFKVNVSNQVGI